MLGDIGGEKDGVLGFCPAVPADVDIITLFGCDEAKVLALSLCAFANASGDTAFKLTRNL
jgi:hypothetical protein